MNATLDNADAAVAAEMPDFDAEMEDAVAYLDYSLSKPDDEPVCPNHAEELTYEGFSTAAGELSDNFGKAVERYYARRCGK